MFAIVLLLAVLVSAQTTTVVNNAGASVVEVISTNAAGVQTTHVLQTLAGSATSQATAATTSNKLVATTTTTAQQGPVAQPASEPVTPGGPTPYEYTTTDANGATVVVQATFTPTGPQTVLPSPTTTGSVLGYSQWLSMIGTNTVPASAASLSAPLATGWLCFAATALAGLVGGAWLVVL